MNRFHHHHLPVKLFVIFYTLSIQSNISNLPLLATHLKTLRWKDYLQRCR